MKHSPTTNPVWIHVGTGLLGLALFSGCALKTTHRQTEVMERAGTVGVSAAELRARVNDLADRLTGRIEETADRIRRETGDRAVRRRALVLKVEGIPAVYTAAYRAEPLAAVVDVWALAFQVAQYVEDGVGRDAFGAQQPLAREAARRMLSDVDTTAQGVAVGPEVFVRARARVEDWAKRHPIETTLATRASMAGLAAELRAEGRDALVAVGAVSDTIENVSERLNTYAAQLPRQARWQAELLITDMAGDREIVDALDDVQALGALARRADQLLADSSGLLGPTGGPLRDLLAAERRALLEDVNGQRVRTLEFVTAERGAALAALHEERVALVASLRQERVETLAEVDAIKTRAVDSFIAGLRGLVDYALWRVAALLLFLMVTCTALGVIGYRLTAGRGRAAGIS